MSSAAGARQTQFDPIRGDKAARGRLNSASAYRPPSGRESFGWRCARLGPLGAGPGRRPQLDWRAPHNLVAAAAAILPMVWARNSNS